MTGKKLEKRDLSDLAILGGDPRFAAPLAVGRPNVANVEKFLDRVRNILDTRWLTNDGPYVQEFERRIATVAGTTTSAIVPGALRVKRKRPSGSPLVRAKGPSVKRPRKRQSVRACQRDVARCPRELTTRLI